MVTEAFYHEICALLDRSSWFEKQAAISPSDANLQSKTNTDVYVFERIKEAAGVKDILSAVGRGLGRGGKMLGKGMLYGALPAATAVGAGALAAPYIIDRAAKAKEEATKRIIEDVRNKALQTALGVGAIGGGLMGVHHLLAGRRQDAAMQPPANQAVNLAGLMPSYGGTYGNYKTGSLQTPVMRDLVEKFATVGYLDVILEANQTDEEYGEDARCCRKLNAEHGIHLLQQMLA